MFGRSYKRVVIKKLIEEYVPRKMERKFNRVIAKEKQIRKRLKTPA